MLALELFLLLTWGFHEIEVTLDPRDAVSSLRRGKERGRGLSCGLRVAALGIQLQGDLALGILRVSIKDLVVALFSDSVLRFLVFLFCSLALLFIQVAKGQAILELLPKRLIVLAISRAFLGALKSIDLAHLRHVLRRELGAGLLWQLLLLARLW